MHVFQVHLAQSCFYFRPRVLGSEKHFPTDSELCKDTPRTLYHCLRKEFREECYVSASGIPAVTLMGRITLSSDYVALISKCLFFQKMQILKLSCGHKEKANEPMCVSLRVKTASSLQSHEVLLLPLGSKSSHVSIKKMSLWWESCVRDSKDKLHHSMHRVHWVCSGTVDCHTCCQHLIWWNWTGWWLPLKKWQVACSFQKTQIMAQSLLS